MTRAGTFIVEEVDRLTEQHGPRRRPFYQAWRPSPEAVREAAQRSLAALCCFLNRVCDRSATVGAAG